MTFDIESYIENYSGTGKIKRLLNIANVDSELKEVALKMAIKLIKNGINTELYQELYSQYKDILYFFKKITSREKDKEYAFDSSWVKTTDEECAKKIDRLENELSSYRTNVIRDSVRVNINK
jgi:COP9 signalosome complex subunit 1